MLQNTGTEVSALGTPPWRYERPVLMTNRVALDQIELPIQWFENHKDELLGSPVLQPDGSLRQEARKISDDVLIMDPASLDRAIDALDSLSQPVSRSLPDDGRLVLVWDRASTELQVQHAYQFSTAAKAARGLYGIIKREEPYEILHMVNGELSEGVPNRAEGDPPSWTTWHVCSLPADPRHGDQWDPAQALPGLLRVESPRAGTSNAQSSFRAWPRGDTRSALLCVAHSSDGSRTWLWFE